MRIFRKLFSRNKLIDPIDFGAVRVDMHSHLIPGIDDGSKNLHESYELVKRLKSLGYRKLITTPHIMSDFYRNDSDTIRRGADQLREYLRNKGVEIEIEAAAEYFCDEHFDRLIEKKDLLSFGNNYVLFELPFMQAPTSLKTTLFNLQMAGYKPILAHPERYGYWHTRFDEYQSFIDKDVLLQVNLNSFSGAYGPQVRKTAEKMVDQGMISLLGTDCHNHNHIDMMELSRRMPYVHRLVTSGVLLNGKL
ncbi:MAG: histidinol phosphatase [Flavobacteriales bacterium]|nr:histidinol phosphatase [Flavobacteriales bacterium]